MADENQSIFITNFFDTLRSKMNDAEFQTWLEEERKKKHSPVQLQEMYERFYMGEDKTKFTWAQKVRAHHEFKLPFSIPPEPKD